MGHDNSMQSVHYLTLYPIMAKSSMTTSFPTACQSASETVGLPGWSKIEDRKLIQDISSRIYLSFWLYKEIKE